MYASRFLSFLLVGVVLMTQHVTGGEPLPRLDHYGDPLPKGGRFRLGTVQLTGVGHRITAIAMTANGRTLLTHARSGALTLWDRCDGRRRRTLDHWRKTPITFLDRSFIVSPNGSRALALPSVGDVPVCWDLASGRRLSVLPGLSQPFQAATTQLCCAGT